MALLADTQVRNVTPLLALDSNSDDTPPVIAAAPNSRIMPPTGDGLATNDFAWSTMPVSDLFFPDTDPIAAQFHLAMAG